MPQTFQNNWNPQQMQMVNMELQNTFGNPNIMNMGGMGGGGMMPQHGGYQQQQGGMMPQQGYNPQQGQMMNEQQSFNQFQQQ